MVRLRIVLVVLLGICSLSCGQNESVRAAGSQDSPRQKMGEFRLVPRNGYYLAKYEFKPYAGFPGYKHHYLISVPGDSGHIYVYSPYACVFWGRFTISEGSELAFEMLPVEHRQQELSGIDKSKFIAVKQLPEVPEAVDGIRMQAPILSSLPK